MQFLALLSLLLLLVVFCLPSTLAVLRNCQAQLKSTNSSLVYDGNNNLIADLGSEKRENVTADSIPINLVNAITSIEDKRFFNHRGVDLYRIFGAAFHNLTSQTTQGVNA